MPTKRTLQYSSAERHLAECDPIMLQLIEDHGPGLVRTMPHGFASLVRIIVGQQLSTIVAARIYERLQVMAGGRVTPATISKMTESQLRSVGLSQAKTNSIRDLVEKTVSRQVRFNRMDTMSNDEVTEMLVQVKGIGPWSAQMYLMFVLNRLDVFPMGDLGIRKGMMNLYGKRISEKQMLKISEKWRPYRTVASYYLWRSLDIKPDS